MRRTERYKVFPGKDASEIGREQLHKRLRPLMLVRNPFRADMSRRRMFSISSFRFSLRSILRWRAKGQRIRCPNAVRRSDVGFPTWSRRFEPSPIPNDDRLCNRFPRR